MAEEIAEKGIHLHHPETGPKPGEIIGVKEKGERRKWGDKLVRKIRGRLGRPPEELRPILSRFETASGKETKDPQWLEKRREELEEAIASGRLTRVYQANAETLLKKVRARERQLEGEKVKEELGIPKEPVKYEEIETPEWVKRHLTKELKTIPQSGRKPQRNAEALVQMARNEIVKIEAANQPFREADYDRLADHKDEIHQFLRSTAETEDKERILWLRYELEARERLQRYWQHAWYGPEGIGKMIKWAKEHSREMLEEHYAALLSIPEVKDGLCLEGYHSEMELSGFQRVGYHLRRLGGTCMFKDVILPDGRDKTPIEIKDLPGFELHDIPENLRKYIINKVGDGTSFEFSLYRTMHTLAWAHAFHKREEWERLLELKTDLEGRPVLDKDGKPTIINHGEWNYTYDMWHDPQKAKFYRWNWDRIGKDNQERLSEEIELDGGKVILANMSGEEIESLTGDQKKRADEAIREKLIDLCKNHDDALNLKTIEWTKIFSDYKYFGRDKTKMPDDYLTNWLVNANYMERTQENFLGGGGYLTLSVDKENPSFATLKEALYGKGERGGSFEHLSLKDRDLEESYWFQELSDIYFPAIKLFRARKKIETSKIVNDLLMEGLDMAYSKELVFKACGIVDKDGVPVKNWATISRNRLTPSERARLILHHLPERAILGTYLAEFGIGWEEFVAYAGWKIRGREILSLEDALDERERELNKKELTETEKNEVREEFEGIEGPKLTPERRKEIKDIIEEKFSILQKKHLDKIIDRAIDFYLDWLLRGEKEELKDNLDALAGETGILDEELRRGLEGNRARRWGPKFDLWAREKAFWLIKRRAMRYAVGPGKGEKILGEYKEEIKKSETGLDKIAVMMMGHGERDPGGADRLPPLYLHFDVNRYLYSRLAHWSAGYWAQTSRERHIDWNRWKLWRLVLNPEKHALILTTLYSMEYLSMEEREGFAQVLGCDPHDQVPSFTRERKGFLIPDIEGKLTPEVTAKETMEGILNIAAATALPIATGLKALPIVPNSWKEFKAMFRNSVTAATLAYMLTPPTLAGLAATGFFGLASWIASNDFGDENRVLSPLGFLTTRGGHIGRFWFGREQKRQPETIMNGGTPAWDDIIDERVVTEWMDKANQLLGDQPVGE